MFLTRLPCPAWCDLHPGHLMRGMAWFPVLGVIIGVWASAIYDAAASLWPPLVAAAVSCGGTLWLTGCFHEDGRATASIARRLLLRDTIFSVDRTICSACPQSHRVCMATHHSSCIAALPFFVWLHRAMRHARRHRRRLHQGSDPDHHARLTQRELRDHLRWPVGRGQGGVARSAGRACGA